MQIKRKVRRPAAGALLLTFGLFLGVWSCSNPERGLEDRIWQALEGDNTVTCEEWQTLRAQIDSTEELRAYTDEELRQRIEQLSDDVWRAEAEPPPLSICQGQPETAATTTYQIFVENSASMDGYFQGGTDFKRAVLQLVTTLEQRGNPVKYHVINQEVYPQDMRAQDFVQFLTPDRLTQVGSGRRGSTQINDLLERVIAAGGEEDVVILISDFINSVKGTAIGDQLIQSKFGTRTRLAPAAQADKGVLVLRLESDFNGTYYDMNSQQHRLDGEDRPYYIWAVGPREKLLSFLDDFRVRQLAGFDRAVLFINTGSVEDPYYSVLLNTNVKGMFTEADRRAESIRAIEIGSSRDDQLQFTVAVDLSQVPEEDDYLMNPEYWTVESSAGESFSVTNVEKTSAAHSNDRQFLQSATHLVTVTSESYPRRAQTLNLKLQVRPPAWIDEVSTDDDTAEDGRADKTFGFKYLLEGAVEAYEYYPERAFINLPITLNR